MKLVRTEDTLTAVLPAEIDHHSATALREEIDRNLMEQLPKHLELDFSNVTFMDSSGMGLVMGRYKKAKQVGCAVEVSGASGRVRNMLSISGITKLVELR